MKLDALPSPGFIPCGPSLQSAAIKAISYVEVMADMKGGKTEQAKTLDTFLVACRSAISTLIDAVLPTYVSGLLDRSVNPRLITLTYSESLDPTIVPAASDFAVTLDAAPLTEVSVSVIGATVLLTVSADVTAGVLAVTYTAPVTNALRDLSGNLLATHGPSAVTNQA